MTTTRIGRSSPIPTDMVIPVDSSTASPDLPISATGRPTKRYTHAETHPSRAPDDVHRPADRRRRRSDPNRAGSVATRKAPQYWTHLFFYFSVLGLAVFFLVVVTVPQKLVRVGQQVATPWGVGRGGNGIEEVLRFVPRGLMGRFEERENELKVLRSTERLGVRLPRLGIVLGSMKKDHSTLMLLTLVKSIREHGYDLEVFAVKDGESHSLWNHIGYEITILNSENASHVDWTIYEGVLLSSLEARNVVSSLKQEPFCSVPLIWIIHEDTLAKRLPIYEQRGWMHLILDWRSVFSRADAVVFPDFSFPMLHSALDTENFFVIPGSPVDVWAANIYLTSHSKSQLRKQNGYHEDDLLILVIGNSLFFDEQMGYHCPDVHVLDPLTKHAKIKGLERRFKLLFLCGNSPEGHDDTFQDIASHLGFPHDSVRHYGFDSDVNAVLLMADIVLHTSFQDEQSFPSLLLRAMSFGIPIIVPDMPIIKKYIVDKVTGFIYHARNSDTLARAFSLAISEMGLSDLAHLVANAERLLSKDMFAVACLTEYMKLLENLVLFPSDTILPHAVEQLEQRSWEWRLLEKGMRSLDDASQLQNVNVDDISMKNDSIVYSIEKELADKNSTFNEYQNGDGSFNEDFPTVSDWEEIGELEFLEDLERREVEELAERTEKTSGSWEHVYNVARKSSRKKFETNERDEGELERIGRPLCIYEIYNGAGAWPFLHHGTIYRGISLSKGVKRSRSDDIDAVERLPLLRDSHYSDLLCEFGAMFSIANKVDNIHKIPWIGFQSWHASGKKVSLEDSAEKSLEETIVAKTKGDVIYFWAKMEIDNVKDIENDNFNFWSTCDILNGGNCRSAFEDSFRKMYGLPSDMPALPPMPVDGDYWSMLHSWVMPTSSFLEFIMFSRMFIDSLHSLNVNTNSCLLGSSKLERQHCYCRMTELLVNVWAYHSARKMVFLDPASGELKEQHPIEQRKGLMWVSYFNFTLLKAMDEDLAEEADDGLRSKDGWLWPLTGEVHWQGILVRERAERFRRKEDKRKKSMEKLIERQKYGYKQKALGG